MPNTGKNNLCNLTFSFLEKTQNGFQNQFFGPIAQEGIFSKFLEHIFGFHTAKHTTIKNLIIPTAYQVNKENSKNKLNYF